MWLSPEGLRYAPGMQTNMTFGTALEALKRGERITRRGWNGRGMYLYLSGDLVSATGVDLAPCIVMFTAQGMHQPGWLASQMDLLADDWQVVA